MSIFSGAVQENKDIIRLTDRYLNGKPINLQSSIGDVVVDFQFWYRDSTPLSRALEDLGVSFKRKLKQLKRYPDSRKRALVVDLPHTLVRYAENEDRSERRNFRTALDKLVRKRALSRIRDEQGIEMEGVLLAEYGFRLFEERLVSDLYLFGVSIETSPNFDTLLAPFVSGAA